MWDYYESLNNFVDIFGHYQRSTYLKQLGNSIQKLIEPKHNIIKVMKHNLTTKLLYNHNFIPRWPKRLNTFC